MANNITVNMENLSDKERETLLSLIEKANAPATSPFDKVADGETYFFINGYGDTEMGVEEEDYGSECLRAVGNYCADEKLLERRAKMETINRLLWVYAMENDNHTDERKAWIIQHDGTRFFVGCSHPYLFGVIKFSTHDIAQKAIEEVIEPFIQNHPDYSDIWKGD